MKRKLTIVIDAGEKTCAAEPGKFCNWLVTERMGTKFVCSLFDRELVDENGVRSGPGWLQRTAECETYENV